MWFNSLKIEDFRCFDKLALPLTGKPGVYAIIGDNGSGKTALLDAAWKLIGCMYYELEDGRIPREFEINQSDIKILNLSLGSKIRPELKPLSKPSISGTIVFDGKSEWLGIIQRGSKRSSSDNYFKTLKEQSASIGVLLPYFRYYPANRRWTKHTSEKETPLYPIQSRWNTYRQFLQIEDNRISYLTQWYKRMALVEFQEKRPSIELETVTKAVIQLLANLSSLEEQNLDIRFDAKSDQVRVNIGHGFELPIQSLSDGYKNAIGMVAEIAYEMAELNPHQTTQTPGIILIDEIDLHLHPKWQKKILHTLTQIFPNIQFITTTHSPFILQSIDKGKIINFIGTARNCFDAEGNPIQRPNGLI